MDCTLGIDVGTAGSKAVLLASDGHILGAADGSHPSIVAGNGRMEQDPLAWWDSVVLAVRSLLSAAPDVRVTCIGVSGQMDGPVLLDAAGEPIGTCHIWADTRATAECEEISALIGNERLIGLVGKPAVPAYTAPKLLWIRKHEPDRLRRVAKVVLPKDYIRSRLTGELATDPSDASNTMLFDIRMRGWSEEITSALGLSVRMLPDLLPSASWAGSLRRDAAGQLGLSENTPVVVGAGDSITAAIASGLVPSGPVLTVIGSAGNVSAVVDSPAIDPEGRVHTGCFATPESWIVTGVQQAAGLALQWLRTCLHSAMGAEEGYEDLVGKAQSVPAGAEGLIFLPHLMGERSPIYTPGSRGAFVGLSVNHTAAHLVRAVMEGVAYAQRGSIDALRELGLPVERLLAAGGGAQSRLWRSIQASVNRLPVSYRKPGDVVVDSSSLGAAMLAGLHLGFFPSLLDAALLVGGGEEESDVLDEGVAAVYEEGFRVYLEASRSLLPLSEMLSAFRHASCRQSDEAPSG